jgi:hypothetical protein
MHLVAYYAGLEVKAALVRMAAWKRCEAKSIIYQEMELIGPLD